MNHNDCARPCPFDYECDKNGGICPMERDIKFQKEMEQINQNMFGSWSSDKRLEFVHEYRKLVNLSCIMSDGEDSPFLSLCDVIESYFPAFEWDQIHDENGDIVADTYFKLIEMARDESISDKEFHDRIIRKNF